MVELNPHEIQHARHAGRKTALRHAFGAFHEENDDVNVLADDAIRQGIKDYSDWPTIPQLYVKGEFIGGCDIITEMTLSGELDTLFAENDVAFDKDAADKIREANA
ncbi:MAG: glutaredoxin domain-containing protein [Pseudomonadota bacterium]